MDCEDCRHLTVVGLHDTGPCTEPHLQLNRRRRITIFRLRTGHCGLLKTWKVSALGLSDTNFIGMWREGTDPASHSTELPTPPLPPPPPPTGREDLKYRGPLKHPSSPNCGHMRRSTKDCAVGDLVGTGVLRRPRMTERRGKIQTCLCAGYRLPEGNVALSKY